MNIELLNHPTQEARGDMVWQTTAQVIRIEIMNLIEMVNNKPKAKENLTDLLEDLKGCQWNITCDANGQVALEEV